MTRGVTLLGTGVTNLDEARKRDYAFARSLLKLPSFSAPDIGSAFFGKVSIDRFQQALYWAELARHYMPPGLLPREDAGPKRLRASGTTVRFPKEHEWPSFLLELGQVDFTIGDGLLKGAYAATVQGVTSSPALYGRPMTVTAKRNAPGSVIAGLDIGAVVDHRTAGVRDSVSARLRGVKLPSFAIPSCRSGLSLAPARPISTSPSAAIGCWAAGPSAAIRWPGRSTAPGGHGAIWSSSSGGWCRASSSST